MAEWHKAKEVAFDRWCEAVKECVQELTLKNASQEAQLRVRTKLVELGMNQAEANDEILAHLIDDDSLVRDWRKVFD